MLEAAAPSLGTVAGPVTHRSPVRWFAIAFFAIAVGFAVVAQATGQVFFFRLATEALIFGGLALSVDLLLGITGLLPLGQALFFGFGAYVSALVLKSVPSFWLALAVAVVASAAFGLVAGIIAIRAKGVYFALISFGLAQVLSKAVYNTRELGASDGIIGIPAPAIPLGFATIDAASPGGFFLLVLVVIGLLYLGLAYLLDTPFGRLLGAIRVNEHRVAFLGFAAWRYKLTVFVLAAVVAGIAGALYPVLRGFVSPELMFFTVSGNAVINVIVGGTGTLIGALYGSAILTVLRSIVGSYTEHHELVIGALFVATVIYFPKGLIGYAVQSVQKWRARASQ